MKLRKDDFYYEGVNTYGGLRSFDCFGICTLTYGLSTGLYNKPTNFTPRMYSGFNNAPHLHTGDVSITELLRIRYELDLTKERNIQIVLIDYNGKVG